MQIIGQASHNDQAAPSNAATGMEPPESVERAREKPRERARDRPREKPPIGVLLNGLRGGRSLRQVQEDTKVPSTYLCSIELGFKRPGTKTLSKLSAYYKVPLQHLLEVAGITTEEISHPEYKSAIEVQRSFDFVMADPNLSQYPKPEGETPADLKKFVVELYQHYTGKKLL